MCEFTKALHKLLKVSCLTTICLGGSVAASAHGTPVEALDPVTEDRPALARVLSHSQLSQMARPSSVRPAFLAAEESGVSRASLGTSLSAETLSRPVSAEGEVDVPPLGALVNATLSWESGEPFIPGASISARNRQDTQMPTAALLAPPSAPVSPVTAFQLVAEQMQAKMTYLYSAAAPLEDEGEMGKIHMVIDGGGVRGVGTATQLAYIEAKLQEHLGDGHFRLSQILDSVGGTSIGSVLGAALATGDFSCEELADLMKENARAIFSRSKLRAVTSLKGLFRAKYDRRKLDALLQRKLGDKRLSDTVVPFSAVAAGVKLSARGYRYGGTAPIAFNTYDAQRNTLRDLTLYDVTRASAAAPGYFDPIKLAYDGASYLMLDGGLLANRPLSECLIHALRVHGGFSANDTVISMQTGYQELVLAERPGLLGRAWERLFPASNGGLVSQLSYVVDAAFTGQSNRSTSNARELLAFQGVTDFLEFSFAMPQLSLDDTRRSYVEALESHARDEIVSRWEDQYKGLEETVRKRLERLGHRQTVNL